MRYQSLGNSDLEVSVLCLGTMMFGGPTDSSEVSNIMARARDAGVNFVDTADVYNQGNAEQELRPFLKASRSDWVLASKVGNEMGKARDMCGLSRRWIDKALDDSLRRLGTDYIDVYYLHREDPDTPLAETVDALARHMAAGKIRYFGVSNFRAWRLAAICGACDAAGVPRPVVSQPYYNALNRMPEVEHLPACRYFGLGTVPYSPLARGVLSGKYRPGEQPSADTRAGRNDKRMLESEWRPESLLAAQHIKTHAEANGTTAIAFALNWVLNNKLVTAVIAGPRTDAQWQTYIGALDYAFTWSDEAFMDRLVAPGHPSTPGYNDPRYPIEGRISRVRPVS
ncbi:MAG: aldo/keto reductase [Gammaproteobacteria bacterium]|nr:aldo/keto reductase [Gammaproteobacteria bacterium]